MRRLSQLIPPHFIVGVALIISVVSVYWVGMSGGFVFDDFPNIVQNTRLHVDSLSAADWIAAAFSSPSSDLQRPLAMLSFAANVFISGLDPFPMKVTNLAIHLLNSILVLHLMSMLTTHPVALRNVRHAPGPLCWFVAAFWALNPINLVPVLYIVQRMEILSHTFVFAGLALYIAGRMQILQGRQRGWWVLLLGLIPCTLLGAMVKESAVLLPLYAFLVEAIVFRFEGPRPVTLRQLAAIFLVLLLIPAIVALALLLPRALDPNAFAARDFTVVERLLTEPRVVLTYFRWTIAPDIGSLGLFHDDIRVSRSLLSPPTTIGAIGAITVLVAFAAAMRRRLPLVSLGVSWFLAAHLLTGTFLPLDLMYEHRNYFASLGVSVAGAELLWRALGARSNRAVLSIASMLIVATFAGLTHLRAREWRDPITFAASEYAKHPQSSRAAYDLGRNLVILGNYDKDSPLTLRAIEVLERARKMPNSGVLPEQALLMTASRSGLLEDPRWWRSLTEKLSTQQMGPQELGAIQSLTRCAVENKCNFARANMIAMFGAALSSEPHPEVQNVYADYALNILGDHSLALRLWQEASRSKPNEVQYRVNRARVLTLLGRFDEADAEISRIASLGRLNQYRTIAAKLNAEVLASRSLVSREDNTNGQRIED